MGTALDVPDGWRGSIRRKAKAYSRGACAMAVDLARDALPGNRLHEYLHSLRARGPVVEVVFAKRPAWLILAYDALAAAFRDEATFPPGEQYKRTIEPIQGRMFESMDGREHHIHRKLATPAFRSRAIDAFQEEGLRQLAHELIDRFSGRGEVDLVAEFTSVFPFLVIARLLGVPRDAERSLMGWARGILSLDKGSARAFTEYMLPALEQRRREPRGDVMSALIQSEIDGQRLDDEEILSNIRALFAAGAMTTHEAMGNMFYALLTHAEALRQVRIEPEKIAGAVEELLRWETPVAILPRVTLCGTRWGGVEIPPGATVLFGITAANRDPAAFDEPDRFDIGRPPDISLSFGHGGSHSCPGIHLARKSILTVTEVFLERFPDLRLLDDVSARPRGGTVRGPECIPVALRREGSGRG